MSNFIIHTEPILSSVQHITFDIYNFNGVSSSHLSFSGGSYHRFNGVSSETIKMKIAIYNEGTRRQANFLPLNSNEISFKTSSSASNVSLASIYGPLTILTIGEDNKNFFTKSKYIVFDPSSVQLSVRRFRVEKNIFMASFSWKNEWHQFKLQEYPGIFTGAVRSRRISANIELKIELGVTKRKIHIARQAYLGLAPKTERVSTYNTFPNIITFINSVIAKADLTIEPLIDTTPLEDYVQKPTRVIPHLNGISAWVPASGSNTEFTIESRILRFRLEYMVGQSIIQPIAKNKYPHNFNGITSNEFNILRIQSSVAGAKFMDLNGLYLPLNKLSATTVAKDSLLYIPSMLFYLAHNSGYKDYSSIISAPMSFRAEESQAITASSLMSNSLDFTIAIIDREHIDLDSLRSNWFSFIYGEKVEIETKGLYRDIFVDETDRIPGRETPWTPSDSGFFNILKSSAKIISFNSGISAFRIAPTSMPYIIVETFSDKIARSTFLLDKFQMAPYIRVSTLDKTDFVLMSATPVGGYILHMHRKGFQDKFSFNGGYSIDREMLKPKMVNGIEELPIVLDSIKIQKASMEVCTRRYRDCAKVLDEYINGVLWDEAYILDAVEFLRTKANYTMEFIDAPYSPSVIKSISLDKGYGLTHKNIFQAPEVKVYPEFEGTENLEEIDIEANVPYIHQPIDSIQDNVSIYEYIVSSRDIKLKKEYFPLHAKITTHKVGYGSVLSIMENCSEGTPCSRWIASKKSVISNVVKRPTSVKSIAVFDRVYKTVSSSIPENPNLIQRENGTIISLNSNLYPHFVHIVSNSSRNGIQSNLLQLSLSYGTKLNGLSFTSNLKIGLLSLSGLSSKEIKFKYGAQDTNLNGLYSDFRIRLVFDTNREKVESVYSSEFPFKVIDNNFKIESISNGGRETIWMKIFPEHFAGKSIIENKIMQFHVSESDFSKEFRFPFSFEESDVVLQGGPSKSGSGDFKEKKMLEIPDILGPTPTSPKVLNILCGQNRETTLLEYSGFDHLLREDDGKMFGRLTWDVKKILMSPFLTIATQEMIRDGVNLSDADALKRTMAEIKLSAIEDLDVVQDWHIEDFKLEAKDFQAEYIAADSLSTIDEVFRNAMKSVLAHIGDDSAASERKKGENQFPAFPDRVVVGDELSTSLKPIQYFIVEEEDN